MYLRILISFITVCLISASPIEKSKEFEIIILHNNDIHGRFEQTDQNGDKCTETLAAVNKCYGGFARTAHVIREYRYQARRLGGKPVLYLNAGDIFTGTIWFAIFKEKISREFMNKLEPDAAALGNHEFDFGVKRLAKFLNNIHFPVVASNLNLSMAPRLNNIPNLTKSIVLYVNEIKIGVVGYLTPDTMATATTEDVFIHPEIEYINQEAKNLRESGVKIIIALGHSGFEVDKQIALNCPEVDLVIGAHTNTFLYSGDAPDIEVPQGSYPEIIEQANGKRVPVVQAYAYTKYLGYLDLKFDFNGDLLNWKGNPILLDSSVPQDEDILDLLEVYRPNVTALGVVVGQTNVFLSGSKAKCRKGECGLGNLVVDSMLYVRQKDLKDTNQPKNTFIAIAQAGGMKSSIDNETNNGQITLNDILTALPFNNSLFVANVKGERILQSLEHSATFYDAEENGGYLQFTGMKVIFNMTNEKGQRVISVSVRCTECSDDNSYEPLDLQRSYEIVFTKFLLKGGDGYKWMDVENPLAEGEKLTWTDVQAVAEYLKFNSPLNQNVGDRQIILQ